MDTIEPNIGEAGEELAVITDEQGRPATVILPMELWERLPPGVRQGLSHSGTAAQGGRPVFKLLPWPDYVRIRDVVDDAIEEMFADEGAEALAREEAAVARARAKGIAAEIGVPFEVAQAEHAGCHPLAAWRKHRGLTQAALAARAGIDRSYLAHLETGTRAGTVEVLARLSRELGCLIEDLVRADQPSLPRPPTPRGGSGCRRLR